MRTESQVPNTTTNWEGGAAIPTGWFSVPGTGELAGKRAVKTHDDIT